MKLVLKKLKNKNVFLILFVLALAICFETFQQLFYIKRFSLNQHVEFFTLLKNQSYRWLIWFVIGFLLFFFIEKDKKKELNVIFFGKYFILIFALVVLNILLISSIEAFFSSEPVTFFNFYSEYFLFFTFQKAPIYCLGYIAITFILYLKQTKEQLQIEVQELIDLKNTNSILYKKLSKKNVDKTKILNIKIGNKRKIISVNEIMWLEADDYCVLVHTINDPSYTMRISLKALQEKLSNNFLRVHRKGIVNMDMVKELNLNSNPRLVLKNDQEVIVSKSNLKFVKDFLDF